jgi:hypothetical protein
MTHLCLRGTHVLLQLLPYLKHLRLRHPKLPRAQPTPGTTIVYVLRVTLRGSLENPTNQLWLC